MSFLNPFLLAGMALAALPLAIHLLDKRRLPKQLLPTMRFLVTVSDEVKRRIRLRDAVLLALRTLAILLLALLVSRPVWPTNDAAGAPVTSADIVYVFDTSFGMRYIKDGETLFHQAKEKVRDESAALPPGIEAAAFGCNTEPNVQFTAGARIASQLDDLAPSDDTASWPNCIQKALTVAGRSRNNEVEIRLLTNLAKTGWDAGAVPQAPENKTVTLSIIDLAGSELPNRGLLDVDLDRTFGHGGESWAAKLTYGNFADGDGKIAVRLVTDKDEELSRGLLSWPTTGVLQKTLEIKPVDTAFVAGKAIKETDNLPEDDTLPLQFYFGKPVKVLIVDGSPGAIEAESESYYLMTALRPGRVESSVLPKVTTRTSISPQDLTGTDVIVLLNVGELSSGTVAAIENFVRNGGGLMLGMGDRFSPVDYERMNLLVPGKFRTRRDLRLPGQAPVVLSGFPAEHPIFRELATANFSTAGFSVYDQLQQLPPSADVLMTLSDGAPALVEYSLGKGRVLWYSSSLDADWNNLPYRPFYLPLMQLSVRYLAGTLKPAVQRTVPVGTPIDLAGILPKQPITYLTPTERGVTLDPLETTVFADTAEAGHYRAMLDGKRYPDADFIVRRTPEASDLRRISDAALAAKIDQAGYGGEIQGGGRNEDKRIDPGLLLLGALGFLFCSEAFLARRKAR